MSQPALDPSTVEQLREMAGGDASILGELLTLFESDANRLLQDLASALAAGNAPAVREAAHAIKGGAANLGAKPLADLCYQVEQKGRGGNLDGAAELAERIREQYALTCQALRDEIAKG